MNKPRKIPDLLTGQDMAPLEHLIKHSKRLNRLNVLVREILGRDVAPHCQIANIRGSTLILAVSSTAWATRLRYQLPELLKQLQTEPQLKSITDIQVKVIPETTEAPKQRPRHPSLSADAALCLNRCAESVDDERLRAALQQLATRQRAKN